MLQIQGVASRAGRGFRYVAGVGSLIGYARVSTAEQSADLQTDELTADGCLLSRADGAKDRSAAGARG